MDAKELLKKLEGYTSAGRGIVRIGGKHTVVCTNIDGTYILNEAGKEMAKTLEEAKPKRTRKKPEPKVEAEQPVAEVTEEG